MPKYAALIYSEEDPNPSPDEMQQVFADYMEFGQNAAEVLRGGEALHPVATATTVHVEGGKGGNAVFTDGPFAETKEVLGGFYLIEAGDLDEALTWAEASTTLSPPTPCTRSRGSTTEAAGSLPIRQVQEGWNTVQALPLAWARIASASCEPSPGLISLSMTALSAGVSASFRI